MTPRHDPRGILYLLSTMLALVLLFPFVIVAEAIGFFAGGLYGGFKSGVRQADRVLSGKTLWEPEDK